MCPSERGGLLSFVAGLLVAVFACILMQACQSAHVTLMSVLSLHDIAQRFRKDERTIRRWCQSGRMPGAFQTKGGHWRVRAGSLENIRPDIERFARARVPAGDAWAEVKRTGLALGRLMRRGRGAAFHHAAGAIVERHHALELLGESPRLADALWESVDVQPTRASVDSIMRAAVALWSLNAAEKGGRGIAAIASRAGIPRRTFERHFAKFVTKDLLQRITKSFAPADEVRGLFEEDGSRVAACWFDYDDIDRRNE
jgi:hypothetical protein